ncbi:MAG TPA: ABC transporter ATP-binding protein [Phycisphaerae bacterium]|nr:ABC transporter ATP-binding protein [Phycisphaerae bacterium]HUT56998.1 ABC transporter ATP-binding protein [Phycisphaerae bacterium]
MVTATDGLAIDLHDVVKFYGRRVHALRGVRMQVGRGEVFGLLGPNGAGKTTLVKIIMTVIRATKAEGTILGRRIGHKPTLQRVGYLPEDHRFPPYLTGRQALHYYAALSKVDRRTRRRRVEELMTVVRMTEWAGRRVGTYSKGMMQRVGLAQALMHDPELIVLDEPTDGLDPMGRREVRQVLADLRGQGRTVFLNSHLLSEVELVCDRVAILDAGKIVRQGRTDELTRTVRRYEIQLEGGDLQAALEIVRKALGRAADESVRLVGACIRVEEVGAADIQPAIDALRAAGAVIASISPTRQSLEDLFVEVVTGSPAPAPPPLPGAMGGQGK